ncbi:hypothetical protein ELE36_10410 [Pseudolysobacter antarcticus]|uniref:CSLREA domain-containing protein n=1 Tax=Pseudolysobacter antarcticus TaxID=2511995 RepID=A0A411HJM5_9GAMM|nr:hypothetical protein [Pseudolysobacter antarcticus]QBB70739.1 hypothetical protein ELE36_10410 [Pseudolysobacter antarcticus]
MKISKASHTAALLVLLGSHAVAGTLTVTDLGDAGTGACGATCTLRDAIASAAPNDTIDFASTLTYPATITLAGQELLVYKNLAIVGPGAGLLAIDGNQQSRILEIAANASVTVSGVALNNGSVSGLNGSYIPTSGASGGGDGYGGSVLVNAGSTLQMIACRLNGNQAFGGIGGSTPVPGAKQGDGGSAHGGAIYSAGTLSIKDSTLISNFAYGGHAGGPPLGSGGPQGSGGSGLGGAIEASGLTEITDSQFFNNSAQGSSGGSAFGGGAGGAGGSARGGALAFSAFSVLSFVTSNGNSVIGVFGGSGNPRGADGAAVGADVYATATVLSRSTVLISTSGATTCKVATLVAQGANLDADNSCQNFTLHGDPKLQVVTSGDATFALPLWGSPLIDAAVDCKDAFGTTLTNDVRGGVRPLDGNADRIAACDLGAVESDELFANGFE